MRALARIAAVAALSFGVSLPGVMSGGAGMPRFVSRDPSEPKPTKLERARAKGKRDDPFFGIKSRGRNAAQRRAARMADAYAKTGRRNRDLPTGAVGTPFKANARNAAFAAALKDGKTHNGALKLARRVAA